MKTITTITLLLFIIPSFLIPVEIFANTSTNVMTLPAQYSNMDNLINDFLRNPITKQSCAQYIQYAKDMKDNSLNKVDTRLIDTFVDFLSFLSGGRLRMSENEYSIFLNLFKKSLSITSLYNSSEINIFEINLKNVKVRVMFNRSREYGLQVKILSKQYEPYSACLNEVGATKMTYAFYASSLENDAFLPIEEVKIINRSNIW